MKKYFLSLSMLATLSIHVLAMSPEELNDVALHSDDAGFTMGLKAGTLGLGVELSMPINSFVTLRVNANGFDYSTTDDSLYSSILHSDKTYHLDTKGVLLDFHVWNIRLSTGLYMNNNTVTYLSQPQESVGIVLNNIHYTAADIAEIESTVNFNKMSPYLGLGWGNNGSSKGWNLSLDVGLLYHGNPTLDVEVKGNAIASALLKQNLEAERKKQEEDLANFPFYPVVMVGLSYSF